jgi:hypothetical protein
MWDLLSQYLGITSDVVGLLSFLIPVFGSAIGYLFWRSRFRRHKFAKVYFPRDREDFYSYYVEQVSKAKKSVYITSDGFNMRNTSSCNAARLMNQAQAKAIAQGATVIRYQMLDTMHLNWLPEIARMKAAHGDSYRTYYNPRFERVGNLAVIDPKTRKAVTEFMLPDPGSLVQSTTARDFGFIHGHQAKADKAQELFERIIADPDSREITPGNWQAIARELFDLRYARHKQDKNFHVFDEEILLAISRNPRRNIKFEDLDLIPERRCDVEGPPADQQQADQLALGN